MQFRIEDMTCEGCVRSVTRAIQSLDPTAQVQVDLASRRVEVTSTAAGEQISAALQAAGFTPQATAAD